MIDGRNWLIEIKSWWSHCKIDDWRIFLKNWCKIERKIISQTLLAGTSFHPGSIVLSQVLSAIIGYPIILVSSSTKENMNIKKIEWRKRTKDVNILLNVHVYWVFIYLFILFITREKIIQTTASPKILLNISMYCTWVGPMYTQVTRWTSASIQLDSH